MGKIKQVLMYPWHHKKIFIPVIIVIILAIIFWPKPPAPLETQQVKKANITETISTTGKISADTSVDLTFLTSSKLVYVGVKEGDMVKKGQTIAVLDQRTLQKNLEDKLRDYSLQRNDFDQTQSDNQNRTPQQALNDDMKRILQDNQYNLEKAVLSVELKDLAKQESVLVSPIDGIVTRADATTPGVNVGSTTTYTIADPTTLAFSIDVDEADIGKVKNGQPVTVTLDAYPDNPLSLKVTHIDFQSHTSDNGGNVFTTKTNLQSDDSNLKYRLGMNGDAEIIVAKKENVLVVSLAALTDDGSVYIKKDGSYEKRKITTGIQSDTEIEVTSGLVKVEEISLQPDEAAKRIQKDEKRFFFF